MCYSDIGRVHSVFSQQQCRVFLVKCLCPLLLSCQSVSGEFGVVLSAAAAPLSALQVVPGVRRCLRSDQSSGRRQRTQTTDPLQSVQEPHLPGRIIIIHLIYIAHFKNNVISRCFTTYVKHIFF